MAAEELSAAWWNDLIDEWFREVEPLIQELMEKVMGSGYMVGSRPPTWADVEALAMREGPAYAAEFLRRLLANPTTSQDAAKLMRSALR